MVCISIDIMRTALTIEQKLKAVCEAYYLGGTPWEPKKGDYYTLCRNDLQLYQIIDEDETHLYTVYCHIHNSPVSKWIKTLFRKDFGTNRVHVPEYIFGGN
jgi:hypothetical protein